MVKHVDSGGQVHLVTNIRKPRKWRRYEYLLSSGILHINTGYKPNGDTRVVMKFLYTSYNSPSALFGARNTTSGSGANNFNLWCMPDLFGAQYNGNDWAANLKSVSLGTSEPFIVDYNKNICTVKGVSATFTKASFTVDYDLLLLALLDVWGVDNRKSAGKLYYCKIYDKDVLIRDFIPAQYNGEYGMWDLVEDKFYKNAGTGSFTVGPEMKNYDEIYEVRKTSSLLPAGVELYDYIESNGNQWINTGVKFNAEIDSCNVVFKGNDLSNTGMIFASSGAKYFWFYYYTGNGIRVYADNGSGLETTSNYLPRDTEKHTMKWENKHYIIDDIDKGALNKNYTETTNNIWLFAWGGDSGNYPFKGRIYYTNIKHNNQLTRNFLPCTYLGEPGMWDTVENKFYRNQGTGLFTLGSKVTLKEYEYLEATGTQYIDTGINATSIYGLEFKFIPVNGSSGNWASILSGVLDNFTLGYVLNNYDSIYIRYRGTEIVRPTISTDSYNTLLLNGNILSIAGKQLNVTTPIATSNGNLIIANNTALSRYSKVKFNILKVYNNSNILLRDMVPVTYNGTPGLWDKVEWKFYGNAGSGSFTLGPEKASGIYPVSYLHDRTIYEEPDGSKWLRIVHHNNPSVRRFNLSDSFTTYVHTSEDLWFDASWCNTLTRWELMVKQKPTSSSAEQKYRWVQNVNPMIATFSNTKRANVTYNTSSGYTTPASSYGGLYRVASAYNYLNGNNNVEGNWWGSIGNCTIYSGGLPGWNELVITTGYEDLYVRIA